MTDETRLRDQIARIGASLFDRGLTAGSSGNISARLPDGGWLMTPTNVSLGALDPARLARFDAEGRLVSGDAPTKEAFLHFSMYHERAEAGAVVHLHSTHATAVSILRDVDPADVMPALTAYYIMRVGTTAARALFPAWRSRSGGGGAGTRQPPPCGASGEPRAGRGRNHAGKRAIRDRRAGRDRAPVPVASVARHPHPDARAGRRAARALPPHLTPRNGDHDDHFAHARHPSFGRFCRHRPDGAGDGEEHRREGLSADGDRASQPCPAGGPRGPGRDRGGGHGRSRAPFGHRLSVPDRLSRGFRRRGAAETGAAEGVCRGRLLDGRADRDRTPGGRACRDRRGLCRRPAGADAERGLGGNARLHAGCLARGVRADPAGHRDLGRKDRADRGRGRRAPHEASEQLPVARLWRALCRGADAGSRRWASRSRLSTA